MAKTATRDAARKSAAKAATKADAALDTKPEVDTKTEPGFGPEIPTVILISDELLDACRAADTGFADQSTKEEDTAYFQRILTTLGEVDEGVFDTLSEGAQNWFNSSVELLNETKPVIAPEGFISKKAAKTAPGKGAAGATKTPTPAKTPAPPKERGPSKTMGIRESVCADPDIKLDALLKAHPDANNSTVSTIRSDVLATLAAVKKTGHWKD